MSFSGALPKHLEVAARTGVLATPASDEMQYQRVAQEIDLTAKSTTLIDLGGMPIPTNDPKAVDTLVERTKSVTPEDWYLTLSLSQNAIDDDQTGTLESRFRNVLPAFQRHINNRVFTVLNAGDGTTYGTGVDGLALFHGTHLYKGAKNTTGQDNVDANTLSLDNFNTGWVKARQYLDDQSNYYNFNYDLLIVHPANRERNPYTGIGYITVPQFDTTAWVLIASNEMIKPLYVAIRKRPALASMWFDDQGSEGGVHYFRYHGRYVVGYGDWATAYMGNT